MDVAVIGAGLAGLHTAHLLAERGVKVLLIDRKESLAAPVHTTGIFVRKTWEDFDLPDEQLGAPIRDVFLYSPALRKVHLTASRDEFRIGRMQWIYAAMLDRCARAGVRWIPAARFESFEGDRVIVTRRGRRETHRARFIVGADGSRSRVAQLLGLDRNTEFLVGLEDIIASSEPPALHCFIDPRLAPGYIAWIAFDGQSAHAGVAGYRDRFNPAAALAEFRSRHFASGRAIERRGGLIPVNGVLRRIACDRGLLVGDAAGAVSPLTAGGLDGAMRLSALAADVIIHNDLRRYDGAQFQTRFIARRWMRFAMDVMPPAAIELAFAFIAPLARHVFFNRGSFPDVTRYSAGPFVRQPRRLNSSASP
ncbi:MAG TPA: NAD(P)/FAD-dependent oxidoreductase [Thermoanaerobaculia bacterium]|nr:NAD(P)/FAD-dependent oxidoreductase [Thermoanaerobaculia bacterium]